MKKASRCGRGVLCSKFAPEGVSGDLLPPSPQPEQSTARQDQTRQTRADDRTGDSCRRWDYGKNVVEGNKPRIVAERKTKVRGGG